MLSAMDLAEANSLLADDEPGSRPITWGRYVRRVGAMVFVVALGVATALKSPAQWRPWRVGWEGVTRGLSGKQQDPSYYGASPAGYARGDTSASASAAYAQGDTYASASAGYAQGDTYASAPAGYAQGNTYANPPTGYAQGDTYAGALVRYAPGNTYGVTAGYGDGGTYTSAPPTYQGMYNSASAQGFPSLYCVALIMPFGEEVSLIQVQLQQRLSLFICNEYGLFSNTSVYLGTDSGQGGQQVWTAPIGGTLNVPHGGRWGTALNTDVFIRFWQAVSLAGRWRNQQWTVKVDADAVFLPDRLRDLLRPIQQPDVTPVYLNNCKWGMHGPIEVISQAGFNTYSSNIQSCEQIRQDAMTWQPVHWNEKMLRWTGTDKDHSFGEDQYLRRCFKRLNVAKIDEFRLLDELACGGNPRVDGCIGNFVSYHPMKTVDQYQQCLAFIASGGTMTWQPWPAPTDR